MGRKRSIGLLTVVAMAALAAPAGATDNGWDYNNEFAKRPDDPRYQVPVSTCVYTTRAPAAANIPIYGFGGRLLPFQIGTTRAPECGPNRLRISTLQRLTIGGRLTYMNRGGGDYSQAHAHVAGSELNPPPDLLPYSARMGNGRSAPGCNLHLTSKPVSMPGDMFYKSLSEGVGSGSSWANYGDPGKDDHGDSYNYILWNMPRRDTGASEAVLPGGGAIMANIGPNTHVYACDVSQQVLNSYSYQTNTINGYTRWAYVHLTNPDGENLWGWFLVSYKYGTGNEAEVGLYNWGS